MSTLSLDLRQRILASYDAGEGTRQDIADRLPGITWHGKEATLATKENR